MSLSKGLKRKVDRTYKEEWKEKYAFILPDFMNAKPVRLICNEAIAVCKEYNVRWHHERKHGTFQAAFPLHSEAKKCKTEALQDPGARLTAQQKVTSAFLKASWVLEQHTGHSLMMQTFLKR